MRFPDRPPRSKSLYWVSYLDPRNNYTLDTKWGFKRTLLQLDTLLQLHTYPPASIICKSHTYSLTPWSRVLLEKLTVSQLVKKFSTFYGTRRFITAFTSAHHLSLSWARSIQYMNPTPHFLKIDLNIILPSTPGSTKWSVTYITVYKHRLAHCYNNTRYISKFESVATWTQCSKSAL